ncbi:hypothetical protein [Neoactinobaculum massilliense]|uniref:hypothetical protein n=1 Tax=Neoactinobaculum massilliense TaxID=2364794 RepID=UPI0019CFF7E4|nr:hypothetical protein [Neoactinobaculum massilliense]
MTTVRTAAELADALNAGAQDIAIDGTITGSPSITLPEGTTLHGGTLEFGGKGVRLTRNNTLADLTVTVPPTEEAIYNATDIADAGTFVLSNVTTTGQVSIQATDLLMTVRVEAENVWVKDADVRGRATQPHGFGVDVLQGGFTLWNRQRSAESSFTATLRKIRVGTPETPVRGSGVFVAGFGDREGNAAGGLFTADLMSTGDVETDGGIQPGTPDKISAGVFVVSGAKVERVVNEGTTLTHGQNDMVLDNWGEVDTWEARADVTSTGPSGIGFVNFGTIRLLDVQAPIVTTGKGARGFNQYDGTLETGRFTDIRTTGDGSIGIQVSKPVGTLQVAGSVTTTGGTGMSLVRGVQVQLSAIALSIKDGGHVNSITVGGKLRTEGAGVPALEVTQGGAVDQLTVGSIEVGGANTKALAIAGHADVTGIPVQNN